MSTPHDALFKFIFSQPAHAAPLLRNLLPAELAPRIDWSSLRIESTDFIDRWLKDRHSDLLYSVELDGSPALIYVLLEHQSGSDWLMPLRLLGYLVRIWEEWLRNNEGARMLPAIVPLVVHHSERGWTGAVEFTELLNLDPKLLQMLGPHVPRLRILLDDLTAAQDTELKARSLTALGELGLQLLRRARYSPDLLAEMGAWVGTFWKVLKGPNGVAAFAALMVYISRVSRVPLEKLRVFVRQFGPAADEAFMTAAQQLREEGIAEGIAKGRAEGEAELIIKQLTKRFGPLPEAVVTRVRAASLEELDRFAERVLDAASLEDVIR